MYRLALAQINPKLGDIAGNRKKIISYIHKARAKKADLVIFPELALSGYPPEDLLLKHHFIEACDNELLKIARESKGIDVIVGYPRAVGRALYNSAAYMKSGRLALTYDKILLPNESVFDEKRYFEAGKITPVIDAGNTTIGLNICEDIWHADGPTQSQVRQGAGLVINISASPFFAGKMRDREEMLRSRVHESPATIAYCNLVGGQDELVFDGGSMVMDARGRVIARAKRFEEELLFVDLRARGATSRMSEVAQETEDEEIYEALVLATRDYVNKIGYKKVLIGLSGGIDSSLTAAIAVDALGKSNVIGITMPSAYTSKGTYSDAFKLAKNLGIKIIEIPIRGMFEHYLESLRTHFRGRPADVTEENIQARIRGNLLMAFANKFGYLVLTTGNKSETSVGFATLYGDTAGGFAVIKDVYKTKVFELSKLVNRKKGRVVIPNSVINRPPTPELKANQKDQDVLPPYSVLDDILRMYVEEDRSLAEIVAAGHKKKTVSWIIKHVDRNEYKRRQAPPGPKITKRAFGKDRRMPIANNFNELQGRYLHKQKRPVGRPKG